MDYLMKDFGKILKKNSLMMRRMLLQENTDCMRVYDRNIEELPVSVELFSKYARITDYSEDGLSSEMEDLAKDMVRRMCYIQGENVIFHRRVKRSNKEQHELQSNKSVTLEVSEASHRFKVDLTKRIDTGLFLDHYKTRKLVQSISDNLRVLNLFSYTGSFSVYAAAGNAALVESVDLSKTYTDWARHNLYINGYEGDKYPCITEDALKYIIDSVRNKKKYDLVIFDPPSFSNSRKMEKDFDVQRDYVRYLKFINNLLEKGGKVIFSTNLSSFHMDPGRLKSFDVKNVTKDILADGFTKKKGTSRTWILEKISRVKLTKEDFEGKKYFTVREIEKIERNKRMDEIQKTEENNFEKIIADLEDSYKEIENIDENDEFEVVADASEVVAENSEVNEVEADTVVEAETEENIVIETEESTDDSDDLVLHWDASDIVERTPRAPRSNDRGYSSDRRPSRDRGSRGYDRGPRSPRDGGSRGYSRDDRGSRSSFDRIERSFTRDDRDSRPSRDGGSRSYSRDDRDRRPSRDGVSRGYSRDGGSRGFSRDDRPSRDGGSRGYSRDGGSRSFSRDDRDRRPSRDGGSRGYSRDGGSRGFSRDDRPSRDGGSRGYSRDGGSRGFSRDDRPSRDGGSRGYSRDGGSRGFSRDDRPSRDGGSRGYSRDGGSRGFSRDDRPSRDGGSRGYSRDGGSRNFSRDDRDRRPSRDGGSRGFSRDDRDRRPSRDGDSRGFSRDSRDRSFSRDDRGSRPSRDGRDRSFSRDDRGSRPSRDGRDRSFSRDDRGSRPSRDGGDRGFSRDRFSSSESSAPREKRVKASKPKPYGFEKKNKPRNDNDF